MTLVLDYGLEVNEFFLQPHYYIHFQANTSINPLNPNNY